MKKVLFILILVFIISYPIFSGSAGRSSGEVLLVYPDANINASGNAGVGLFRPNWQYVQLNPAYLSILKDKTVGFSYNKYIESMAQSNIALVNELKTYRYYFGINYFDYGNFDRTTYSNFINTGEKFSAKSIVIKNYYSAQPISNLYTGLGIKFLYEKLDNHTGSAFAVDLGCLYLLDNYPAAIGFTIQNIGTKIEYYSRKEDLPLLFRIGASYYTFNNRLGLFLDVEKIRNQSANLFLGLEILISQNFSFRSGFDGANDISKGMSLGFDFDILNGMELNYAYIPNNDFDGSHKLTLTYIFGKLITAQPELKREQSHEYAELLKLHEQMLKDKEVDLVSTLSDADIIYYNLALLHFQRGNYQQALNSVNQIQELDEDSFKLKSAILKQLKK